MRPRPRSRPTTAGRLLRVDGDRLHVLREGAGPPVLLSAGLGLAWFEWDEVAARLSRRHTVVRFDRPGLGLSPLPGRAGRPPGSTPPPAGPSAPLALSSPTALLPTATEEARRIAGVLDAAGVPGPAVVVGHSVAGFHAEAFARLYPRRAAGVVLVDSSAEPDPRPFPLPALRAALAAGLGAALHRSGLPAALGPALHRSTADPRWTRPAYGSGRSVRAALLERAGYRDTAAELAVLRRLHAFPRVPLEVLAALGDLRTAAGRQDWLERQRTLADAAPRGSLRVLADSRHLVMRDRPDAVVRAVGCCVDAAGGTGSR